MAKKSLGDLLREEVQKPLELQDSQELAESPTLEVDEFVEPEETPSVQEQPLEITASEPETTSASYISRARTTKAELETMVSELKKTLQQARRQEKSLQQQLTDLQSDLQEQKTLVKKLQADLINGEQIKAELEQAKKVILQLSEVNSKSSEKVEYSAKEKVEHSVKEKVDHSVKKNQNLKLQRLPLENSDYPLAQPSSPSTELSNKEVGWFD